MHVNRNHHQQARVVIVSYRYQSQQWFRVFFSQREHSVSVTG